MTVCFSYSVPLVRARLSSSLNLYERDAIMDDAQNAYEYLDNLKRINTNAKPSFSSLRDYLDLKAKKAGVPLRGQFELSPLCNFDCKMCYTHLTREQMGRKQLLTTAQWKDLMREAWEAGMLCVNLTGGECLAYPGFEEIYLYLRALGCELTVLTNGALLDDKWIQFFRENRPYMIQITLYGSDDDHYEKVTGHRKFEVVANHIRRAREADLPVVLTVTPSSYQKDDLYDTLRAARSFDTPVSINSHLSDPKEETGRSGVEHDMAFEEYVRLYEFWNQLRGISIDPISPEKLPPPGGPHCECSGCGLTCKAGLSCFTVEWDGKMYACNSIRDIWAEPLKTGFAKAWEQIHQKALAWPIIPECIDCPYESVCSNCAVFKQRFAEPGKQPLALCQQTRSLVARGLRRIPACE